MTWPTNRCEECLTPIPPDERFCPGHDHLEHLGDPMGYLQARGALSLDEPAEEAIRRARGGE